MKIAIDSKWGIAAACLVAGFFLGGAARSDGIFGSATAAWVQGVGTIAAVLGAAWIAARQSREAMDREQRAHAAALRREQAALQSRRSSLIGICEMVVVVMMRSEIRSRGPEGAELLARLPGDLLDVLRPIEASLNSFPFEALESAAGAAALVKLRSQLPSLIRIHEALVKHAKQEKFEEFKIRLIEFKGSINDLEANYLELCGALGFPPLLPKP